MNLYLDTETVGLNGPCKLIQYSIDRGPVQFIKLFKRQKSFDLPDQGLAGLTAALYSPDTMVVGYNLSFDLYHMYRVVHQACGFALDDRSRSITPFKCKVLDLYNHAVRKGPYAPWAFSRKGGRRIVVARKIPRVAKDAVCGIVERELKSRLPAGVKLSTSTHTVKGRKDLITLSWVAEARLTLKQHAAYFGAPDVQHIEDVWPVPPRGSEKTWLPYPESTPECDYEKLEEACEEVMRDAGEKGRKFYLYATNDIEYLWRLEDNFGGSAGLRPNHNDSSVAAIAYTRYFGFPVDAAVLHSTREVYAARLDETSQLLAGVNLRSSKQRLAKLKEFEPWIQNSSKATLAKLARDEASAVGQVAKAMLNFGKSKQRLDQVNKLLECKTGRAHPSLRVMGTATNRMAGEAGFNYQGIAQAEGNIGVRAAILAVLGGDFSSFELAIAASAWQDSQMLSDLDNGVDIHLATALECHPDLVGKGLSYDAAFQSYKNKNDPGNTWVTRCRLDIKRVVFGLLYGATAHKVEEVLGLPEGLGERILDSFFKRYAGAGAFRQKEELRFLTADTETWFRDSVGKMDRVATDLTGDTRHFDFEADVANLFWNLGHDLKKFIREDLIPDGLITRNPEKGPQTIFNATKSALLGAALSIQQAVCRAAINTPIQMSGGNLTKLLGARIWEKFHVPMLNVHDEIIFPAHPNVDVAGIKTEIAAFENEYRTCVKHIKFEPKEMERWSDK